MKTNELTEDQREKINHKAYANVLEENGCTLPDDTYYIKCYNFWNNIQNPGAYLDV